MKLKITRGWSTDFITDPWQTSIGGTVYGGALAMHIYACRTPSLASCIAYLTPCGRDTAPRWWDTTRRGVMHFSSDAARTAIDIGTPFACTLISKFRTFFDIFVFVNIIPFGINGTNISEIFFTKILRVNSKFIP